MNHIWNCLRERSATDGRCGEIKLNDFHADLAYSYDAREDRQFNKFYLQTFPMAERIELCEDMERQHKGIDKIIHLKNGSTITIDEKKRRKDYGDILLETRKNVERRRLGWLYYSQCDYIVYAVLSAKKIYLLPTTLLQMAWRRNRQEWERQYKKRLAKNCGYTTENIPIPTDILLAAIAMEMQQVV